jgi:hypothetical protein
LKHADIGCPFGYEVNNNGSVTHGEQKSEREQTVGVQVSVKQQAVGLGMSFINHNALVEVTSIHTCSFKAASGLTQKKCIQVLFLINRIAIPVGNLQQTYIPLTSIDQRPTG